MSAKCCAASKSYLRNSWSFHSFGCISSMEKSFGLNIRYWGSNTRKEVVITRHANEEPTFINRDDDGTLMAFHFSSPEFRDLAWRKIARRYPDVEIEHVSPQAECEIGYMQGRGAS
jgi:hypothetical protein